MPACLGAGASGWCATRRCGRWVPAPPLSLIGVPGRRCVGVVCDPEVREVALSADDAFLILASDGLWTFVSPQEAAEVTNKS